MKRRKGKNVLINVTALICLGCLSGCGDYNQSTDSEALVSKELKTLSEIRKEAESFTGDYENLDLSGTVIVIPDVEEISSVIFPISTDPLEMQIEKFEDNIRRYNEIDESRDLTPYMSMMYWDEDANDRLAVPYIEAKEDEELMNRIQYLSYNDGTCSELLIFSDYMLEMGEYGAIPFFEQEAAGYAENPYGVRGIDLGTLTETFDYSKDDISGVEYNLVDGEYYLQEAVDFVEKHVKEDYYFVGSEYLDYHVSEIEVRKLTDDVFYYQFRLYPSYMGIALNKDSGSGTLGDTEDNPYVQPFGTTHRVSVFCHDKLGFIWSSCHSYESVNVQETNSEFLSLDDVCEYLNQYVTASNPFSIESIELIYQTEFQYENEEKRYWGYVQSVNCHPAYHFTVADPGLSGYDKIYFDVDALTGIVTTTAY